MAGKVKPERWPGGYVHLAEDKTKTFIIEKRIAGERFHVSTRCGSLTAAMKQLERFQADPLGYSPAGVTAGPVLSLTSELALEFHAWSTEVRGNTRKHANEMGNRLKEWMIDLRGLDLRGVTLRDHIKPALERRPTCRQHRIIALKSFFGWLRKERGLLTSAQDPTLDLMVPGAVPEKHKRRKALSRERVLAAVDKLEPSYRDCLALLIATGWHVTELERFIREGEITGAGRGPLGPMVTLATRHKNGATTRSPLSHSEHVCAAERLHGSRTVPRKLNEAIKTACRAADVEPFTLGVMRHTVATWAIEAGATPAEVAEFLNHKDKSTTERFYIDVGVPTVSVPVLRLVGR